ncbi:FKBP-type peptidyl-prolyl cis-trans isomerase [Cellulosimicrobium terreum]|nr:FKBP-type peptidyl-prolyl cis-trans isomerase [Cellulosimicrobium terreum]
MRALALTLGLLGTLVLAACQEPEDVRATPLNTAVEIAGSAGEPPEVTFTAPLDVPSTRTEVVWPGTGPALDDGGPVLLNMYTEDGRDGSLIQSTFADAPQWYALTDESVGPGLADALRGQRVGARVLVVEADESDGAPIPVVMVVDVLPTGPTGDPVEPVEGAPTVADGEDGEPVVSIDPDTTPPTDLAVAPLVRGDGRQVEAGQVVTVRYSGVRWSDGTVVDSSWQAEDDAPTSVMIGIGEVVEGWEQGLLEQSVGSRVMLVVPPDLGYGDTASPLADETLVYVVDILDAHFPVTEEAAETDPGSDQPPAEGADQ